MTTNITNTDSFIFSRRNSIGEDLYFKTSSAQMSEYFRDVYSQELDTLIAEVERIESESEEGDILINNRIDAYADRVRVVASNTLPIVSDGYWAYRVDINSLSTFKYNYNACVGGFDQTDPIIDPPDEEECLEKHALKFYENLLNEPTQDKDGGFYVLTQEADQQINHVTHICISNDPLNTPQYESTGSIDWETVVLEEDIIQLATTTRTATGAVLVDDEHYGMFKVISVTNLPTVDGSEPFSMLRVKHIGGPSVSFVPLTGYQIKVMKSLGATISEDFVQKSGDIMTGPLTIDAATVDNPRTFFNKGEAQTYDLTLGAAGVDSTVKTLGDGATTLSIESAAFFITTTAAGNSQIRINDTGATLFNVASYDTTLPLNSSTNITHKAYVDDKDATLEEKINQTNDRIDNISDVLEKQTYTMGFVTEGWTAANTGDLEQWFTFTAGQITSNSLYPNKEYVYPKPTFAKKDDATGVISPLNVDEVNALLVSAEALDGGLGTFDVNEEDIIELQLVTDDVNTSPQIVRYTARAFDINVDTAASRKEIVDGEDMFLIRLYGGATYLGDAEVIEGASYIIKQFPRNQGISIEDADNRYLLKEGNDTKIGTLEIKNTNPNDGPTSVLRFIDIDSSLGLLEVDSVGNVDFIGSKVTFRNLASETTQAFININFEGIDFVQQTGKIKRQGADKISIHGTFTDFHQNKLTNVLTAAENDADDVVATLGWVKQNLFSRFVAGHGIGISQQGDNLVKIEQINSRLQELDDVIAPSGLSGGETLTYDSAANKWVVISVDDMLRGKSIMGSNEQDTNVGGIWTDGTNFFLRVE